jgi:hypothetical protein
MWFETGAAPVRYVEGVRIGTLTQAGDSWAYFENYYFLHDRCGNSLMNCNNNEEIYSFHIGGAFYGMGDGAVRFVHMSIDPEVFVSLFTPDEGDIIGDW